MTYCSRCWRCGRGLAGDDGQHARRGLAAPAGGTVAESADARHGRGWIVKPLRSATASGAGRGGVIRRCRCEAGRRRSLGLAGTTGRQWCELLDIDGDDWQAAAVA